MGVAGTVSAVASLEEKTVTVTGTADYEALKQAIIAEDYEVVEAPKAETIVIRVNGMMCGHCTASVEKACMGVPGTLSAVASLEDKNVTVTGTAAGNAVITAIVTGFEETHYAQCEITVKPLVIEPPQVKPVDFLPNGIFYSIIPNSFIFSSLNSERV